MRKRALCLWFPDWAIQRRLAIRGGGVRSADKRDSSSAGAAVLILHAMIGGRGSRVIARSVGAGRQGIAVGMPMAEAQALVERNRSFFEVDDPIADRNSLDRLASWCQRYSPLVSLELADRPESLFLDITGCAHLWGGEEGLATSMLGELNGYHLSARIGVADTFGAAWGVAHYQAGSLPNRRRWIDQLSAEAIIVPLDQIPTTLGPLPVEALRLPLPMIETLHELGIERIEQIEEFPRESWLSRFDPELLLRLDQAMGRVREIIVPKDPPPEIEASWILEYAITRTDAVLEIIDGLLRSLLGQLPLGWGITQLEIIIRHDLPNPSSSLRQIPVGLCRPSAQADHLLGLIRLALERTRLEGPVIELRVHIKRTAPLEIFQGELFESDGESCDRREIDSLIDRLSIRLGRQRVVTPRIVPDAQPERCCREEPAGDHHPRSRRSSSIPLGPFPRRPLRLLPQPRPIDIHVLHPSERPTFLRQNDQEERIVLSWGPERIETGWWRGRPIGRDYYRIELESGSRVWIFRDLVSGKWFLQGAFE